MYLSTKVPFAVNYVDGDLDVTHINDTQGEHGSHVAGIAAGNRFVETSESNFEKALDTVLTQGNAPDAQIIVMKVFGKGGGAYDSDYMSAIEDAIVLGADSVNLSLGSGAPGFATSQSYQDIMDSLADSETLVVMSAGNAYSWGNTTYFGYNYWDDPDLDTVGSPGSFNNSLAVASVDNVGITGMPIVVGDMNVIYAESTGYNNAPITTIAGDHEYVMIDSIGTDEEFAAVADVLKGKVALCSRGTSSFYQKANAAVANGAIATVIYNNQAGVINMNLTGYEYTAPAVSITQADAEYFRYFGTKVEMEDPSVVPYYYTGTLTVTSEMAVSYGDVSGSYTMSSFSSWGVPGDLTLKPEITAPGGSIYSVWGANNGASAPTSAHDQYELMSGTSMAAPQVTGIAATLAQFIRENDLLTKSGLTMRQLLTSLLMSTARPLYEDTAYYQYFYSILKQGAGLADILAATQARSYVLMDESATASAKDGKIKVELFDDPEKKGVYSAKFTLNNLTDEEVAYDLNAAFFTQDMSPLGRIGNKIVGTMEYETAPLDAVLTWYINGEQFIPDNSGYYRDYNGDGVYDINDALTLLEYVVGSVEEIQNADLADLDEDGDVDSHDAYLALTKLNIGRAICPANGSIEVEVVFDLKADLSSFETIYKNYYGRPDVGLWLEGYIFADETSTVEGVKGTSHSIPVLGYYGNWSDSSIFDKGSYLEYLSGEEVAPPYMYYVYENNAYNLQTWLVNYPGIKGNYIFGGNPYGLDEGYHPERNAINAASTMAGYRYTAIRNFAGSRFQVFDKNGELLSEVLGGSNYSAYYYVNGAEWRNTNYTAKLGYKAADLEEGDTLKYVFTLAPEYYGKDGKIDWEALGAGTSKSVEALIDNTAPTVDKVTYEKSFKEVEETDPETGETTTKTIPILTIKVTVTDNEFTAIVYMEDEEGNEIGYFGSDEEVTEKGLSRTLEFTLEDVSKTHLLIGAGDYAANEVTYKINTVPGELQYAPEIELDAEELKIVKGNSVKLTATVSPWGIDETVTWSSSDESVATVDEDGIVTAVKAGTATIKAVPKADTTLEALCSVTVIEIEEKLDAVIWDAEGTPWYASFESNTLPQYVKKAEAEGYVGAVAVDADLTTYAEIYDPEDETGMLYKLNADYTLAPVGDIGISAFDLAAAPSLDMLVGVYGPYVLIIDKETGAYTGVFDFSNYVSGNLVGVAYESSFINTYYNLPVDWFYFVDDEGNLYETGFIAMGGSVYNFTVYDDGNAGYESTAYYYNSLYMKPAVGDDGEPLERIFWSDFNQDDNVSHLICLQVDMTTSAIDIFKLGSSEDGVWPIAGLYEEGKTAYEAPAGIVSEKASRTIVGQALYLTPEYLKAKANLPKPDKKSARVKGEMIDMPAPIGGGLNRVFFEKAETVPLTQEEDEGLETIKLLAAADESGVSHNGLYTVELTDSMELVAMKSNVHSFSEFSVKLPEEANEKRELTFGFISVTGLEDGTVVAELTFRLKEDQEYGIVTLKTLDAGDKDVDGNAFYEFKDGKVEEVEEIKHTVSFETNGGSEIDSQTVGHLELAKEPEEAPTKENFTFIGWYADEDLTQEADFEAPVETDVKFYAAWKPVGTFVDFTWNKTEDGYTAMANFLVGDETKSLDAEVTSETTEATCEDEGQILYTAFIGAEDSLDNSEHTDTKTDVLEALGHKYTFTSFVWTKTDDGYEAKALFVCENDASHEVTVDAVVTSEKTDPTCEEAGKTVYTAVVTKEASIDEEEHTDTKEEPIEALGHDWEFEGFTWAEDGKSATASYVCKRDEKHTVSLDATMDGPQIVNATTCDEPGVVMYIAVITEANAPDGIKRSDWNMVSVEAVGHEWGKAVFTWSRDGKMAIATRTCLHDETHVETVYAEVTGAVKTPATCETKGTTTYTATATFEDGTSATDTKDVEDIEALGHEWGEASFFWSADNLSAKATRSCTRDASHVDTIDAVVTTAKVAPTCETKGKTIYTATAKFDDGKTFTATKEVEDTEALGHKWTFVDFTWAEDNSATANFKCENDNTHTEAVKATVTCVTTPATTEKEGSTVYTATVSANDSKDGKEHTDTKTVVIPKEPVTEWTWTRLGGSTRYATMKLLTEEGFTEKNSCKTILVATGEDFVSGLLASGLAGALNAPLLTAPKNTNSKTARNNLANTKKEIERLAAAGCEVIILGSTSEINDAVKTELEGVKNVAKVTRITAASRELLAQELYKKGKGKWNKTGTAILTTGYNYADALSISPFAFATKTPIFYAQKDKSLRAEDLALLTSGAFGRVIILGGPLAVSEDTEKKLTDEGLEVLRLAGSTRYNTSAAIVKWATGLDTAAAFQPDAKMSFDNMGVTTGQNFADALVSVNLLGKKGSVMLLVDDSTKSNKSAFTKNVKNLITANKAQMKKGYILGGELAISKDIEDALNAAVK